MKISNSKKELARIISDNGGWRNGEFAAQDGNGGVGGYEVKPEWDSLAKYWWREALGEWFLADKIKNHHQTVLSRAEYFHLYPMPDADVGSLSSALDLVTDENKHEHVDSKPTIEQLAADYRAAKDYAERKQQEADDAKADAEAKLAELVAAGKWFGLVLSVAGPELVITDWRDLKVGDLVELINRRGGSAKAGEVGEISKAIGNGDFYVDFPSQSGYSVDHSDIKFIRRP